MKVAFKGSNINQPGISVSSVPWTLVADAQIAVGLVAVQILVPAANVEYQLIMANRSGAAQNIRIGTATVAFGPPASGFLLAVSDALVLTDIFTAHYAVADVAAAALDLLVYQRAYI